jgi:phosphoserine phosphatase
MATSDLATTTVESLHAHMPSWREGAAKDAVFRFVARVCGLEGAHPVPIEERVAVFDNDGTLWCEKPMPIQLDFILRRFVEMAAEDPDLCDKQPWKAAVERDVAWLEAAVAEHYRGDDRKVRLLTAGVLQAHADISVERFEALAGTFLRETQHPTLGRPYVQCAFKPMVELLDCLAAHGFTTYVVSGGGRDFMRPVSHEVYGVPRERVIGSALALSYVSDDRAGTVIRTSAPEYLDDGPEKPVRIWATTGRRPLFAVGNANGDIPMLEFAAHDDRPTLRLVVRHDDGEREFDYVAGAERVLERAGREGWVVISVRDDWETVFGPR